MWLPASRGQRVRLSTRASLQQVLKELHPCYYQSTKCLVCGIHCFQCGDYLYLAHGKHLDIPFQ